MFFISCNDKSVNNDSQATSVYKQGKCRESFLKKGTSETDSVFAYTFNEKLKIDFSVSANCCPDSNRFSVSNEILSDTIFVAVADTAEKGCYCVCPYMIELEFSGLTNDSYLVICEDFGGYKLHKVRIFKNPVF